MFKFIKRLLGRKGSKNTFFEDTYVENDTVNQVLIYKDKNTHKVRLRVRYFTKEQVDKLSSSR